MIKPGILSIVLACCMIICTMCKKKETESGSAPSTSQRTIGYNYYLNDTLIGKGQLTYNGSLVAEILQSMPGWGDDSSKSVYQYSGSKISTSTEYEKSNGVWNKMALYEITGYIGDNPGEIILHQYYQGVETIQTKNKYFYNGSLLKEMESFYLSSGTWELSNITRFIYDINGRIVQTSDTNGYWGHITTYHYEGDHRTESLEQEYSGGVLSNYSRIVYEYANNRLSRSIYYQWISGSWNQEYESQFEYNNNGNLSREKFANSPAEVYSIEFIYGNGSGNYRQIQKISGGTPVLPGDPFPYPVKSSGPLSRLTSGQIR
jgi:hypothetical protein